MAPKVSTLPTAEEIGNLVWIGRIAKETPYTADFLRQLARSGKIRAFKLHRDWMTTPDAIRDYLKSQQLNATKSIEPPPQTAEKALFEDSVSAFAGLRFSLRHRAKSPTQSKLYKPLSFFPPSFCPQASGLRICQLRPRWFLKNLGTLPAHSTEPEADFFNLPGDVSASIYHVRKKHSPPTAGLHRLSLGGFALSLRPSSTQHKSRHNWRRI